MLFMGLRYITELNWQEWYKSVQIVFVREKIFLQIFIIPATIYYRTILFLLLFLIRWLDTLWHCQFETQISFLGKHGGRSLQGVFMVGKRTYFGLGMSVRWIIFICSIISTFQEFKVTQVCNVSRYCKWLFWKVDFNFTTSLAYGRNFKLSLLLI
jgi:hypothetical protein